MAAVRAVPLPRPYGDGDRPEQYEGDLGGGYREGERLRAHAQVPSGGKRRPLEGEAVCFALEWRDPGGGASRFICPGGGGRWFIDFGATIVGEIESFNQVK